MSVQKKIEAISKIPTLPEIAISIMKKTASESGSSISEISKLIQKDTSLTTNVLRLVNSPFYNIGKSIGNLQQALVILGTNEIRNLVISISLYSIYQSKNINDGFKKVWEHSMTTALVSQYISQTISFKSDLLFISSLLHDIGWLLIHQNYKELADKYEEQRTEDIETNILLEEELFGMRHEKIGAYAATLWGLPDDILTLIECHHAESVDEKYRDVLSVLQLADYYTEYYMLKKEDEFEEPIMEYFPLIESFSEKYPKLDFLNEKSEFFKQIISLLSTSKELKLTYH